MGKDEKEDKKIEVSESMLVSIQEQMAAMEIKIADGEAEREGLKAMVETASTAGEPKLREKKNFEPKFRTVRVRKYPIGGDETNLGYVIGWTKKGAYQEVDRTGPAPVWVDYIDVIFLGQKNKAEKIKLLDLLNKGIQVYCKVLKIEGGKKEDAKLIPTGEELSIVTFDPQHGMTDTGEKIDGYVAHTEAVYIVSIPGVADPVEIGEQFLN